MNKAQVNKNKIEFYCICFSIFLVGLICTLFIVTNSFITSKSICKDLVGKEINCNGKQIILNEEDIINFQINGYRNIIPFKEKKIDGVLDIEHDGEIYNIELSLVYISYRYDWEIERIRYD